MAEKTTSSAEIKTGAGRFPLVHKLIQFADIRRHYKDMREALIASNRQAGSHRVGLPAGRRSTRPRSLLRKRSRSRLLNTWTTRAACSIREIQMWISDNVSSTCWRPINPVNHPFPDAPLTDAKHPWSRLISTNPQNRRLATLSNVQGMVRLHQAHYSRHHRYLEPRSCCWSRSDRSLHLCRAAVKSVIPLTA